MEQTKKCQECKSDIPKKATRCSHCSAKQKKQYSGKHLLIGLFLVGALIWSFSSSVDEQKKTQNQPDGQKPYIIAQNYVELALKSPSTADFPSFGNVTDLGNSRYRISSYVDAQNSFGAQIRNNWNATIKHKGGDWSYSSNWELEELILDNEVIYPAQ